MDDHESTWASLRDAKRQLFRRYLALAEWAIREFRDKTQASSHTEEEVREVVEYAVRLALVKAIDRFDPDRGTKFSTFFMKIAHDEWVSAARAKLGREVDLLFAEESELPLRRIVSSPDPGSSMNFVADLAQFVRARIDADHKETRRRRLHDSFDNWLLEAGGLPSATGEALASRWGLQDGGSTATRLRKRFIEPWVSEFIAASRGDDR
ncbi:MAG: hypothetical protein M3394_00500 [Actinomycetota bacterium]|nr:hypothetical protein [Actinomycetota bacterium]